MHTKQHRSRLTWLLLGVGSLMIVAMNVWAETPINDEEAALTELEQAYNAAVQLLETQRDEEARAAFLRVVEMPDSGNPREIVALGASWANLGVMALERGQLDAADKALEQAIGLHPNAVALNNLGALRLLQGRYKEAVKAYKSAIRTNPRYVDSYNNLAQLMVESRQYRNAGELLLRALRLEIVNERSFALLAQIYKANDMPELAEKVREEWLRLSGTTPEVQARVALSYLGLGIPDQARAVMKNIQTIDPEWGGINALKGRILAAEEKWAKAAVVLREVLRDSPRDAQIRSDLVTALLRSGDAVAAANVASQGTQLMPEDAEFWFLVGLAKETGGDIGSAKNAYQRAIEIDPRHSRALTNLGIRKAAEDRQQEAIHLFEQALQGDPYNHEILYNLGRALAVTRVDYERGIRLLGFAARGRGESSMRARDFINRLYNAIGEPKPADNQE